MTERKQSFLILVVANLLLLISPFVYSNDRIDLTKYGLDQVIKKCVFDKLGGNVSNVSVNPLDSDVCHVVVSYNLQQDVHQDNCAVQIEPGFTPTFHWIPHLTPYENSVVDQHVFRSPAIIVSNSDLGLALIPDLSLIRRNEEYNWYLDLDVESNRLLIGWSNTEVSNHVLFNKVKGAKFDNGNHRLGFYILKLHKENLVNPFELVGDFLWEKWGSLYYNLGYPIYGSLEKYVERTYNWAFDSWKDQIWQEFSINNRKVGAPCFIVNYTQSPNYKGEVNLRETLSIWNQAWFSSLRSASGLFRYARRMGDDELLEKAKLSKELALSVPQKDGLFYSVVATEMYQVKIGDSYYNRSKGWETKYFGNSNRNPVTSNLKNSPFHLLDMSWTASIMLNWYLELERDERLLTYSENYAERLLKLQYSNGFFPAWLDVETQLPIKYLNDSPESSMSALFLLKLYDITHKSKYKHAALKTLDVIIEKILPEGRWEDFETYWSCSRWGYEYLGKKIPRNNMFKQCNFSMFWTAEAFLTAYLITEDDYYIEFGKRVLDELLMTQSIWQPDYIYVKAFGGFGVMNADGEWNDARASLFTETILKYGLILDKKEYIERAFSALCSSFSMMYCPENSENMKEWNNVYPFFNEKDYGFTMENYGHDGKTSPEGIGIGEFTIYDWGNGAASENYNRLLDHYGEDFIHRHLYR